MTEPCSPSPSSDVWVKITKPLPEHLTGLEKQVYPVAKAVVSNINTEIQSFREVTCFSRAFYSGSILGGILGGIVALRRHDFSFLHYGFFGFIGGSILSWEYCRLNYKFTIAQAVHTMKRIQENPTLVRPPNDPDISKGFLPQHLDSSHFDQNP